MGCRKLVKGEYMKKVYIYIVEPIVEPHPNLIEIFEPKPMLILAELEPKPEPCDLDFAPYFFSAPAATLLFTPLSSTTKILFPNRRLCRDGDPSISSFPCFCLSLTPKAC